MLTTQQSAYYKYCVIPLIQGIVLYQESLAEEVKNLSVNIPLDVDSKSWRQVDLEEKN